MPRARLLSIILVVAVTTGLSVGLWFMRRHAPPHELPFPVGFVDVTEQAGIRFSHFNGMAGKKLLPETMGSGVAVLDFDGDGRPDLFFVNFRAWPGQPVRPSGKATQALYRNRGDGTFEDVTAALGLDVELFGMGVAVADFDNDQWPDIFISAVGGNKLFRNLGGKRFEDVTSEAGVGGSTKWPTTTGDEFLKVAEPISFPASAGWLDYDGDGRLDPFVCNYLTWSPAADLGVQAVLPNGVRAYVPPTQFRAAHCSLYRNIDGKRFEDVTAKAGVTVAENGQPVAKALGVCVCDPDRDGWPDIVVACDTTRNLFFHNIPDADGGRKFEEIGLLANVAYAEGRPRGGMGIDADSCQQARARTLLRPRNDHFSDTAVSTGLAAPSRAPMKFGAIFFDADLDGRPDFFTANGHLEPAIASAQAGQSYAQEAQLFWNTGEPARLWTPATAEQVGPDLFKPIVGRGCAYLDFDGDGDLDLIVTENGGPARLLRNDNTTGHNWIAFSLVGNGVTSNRDAIGAEIIVEAGGRAQRRYVTTARGYLSQSDLVTTFGLGPVTTVDKVSVRWPGRGPRANMGESPTGPAHTLTE